MLSDNKIDSDKSSGVPISHQMSTLYLPSDDAHAVGTDLRGGPFDTWGGAMVFPS